MPTAMLVGADDWACSTRNAVCGTAAEAVAHLKGNSATMGFTVQFAVHPGRGEVVEIIKKGKPCQRDVKALVDAGFTEWLYSWAFAGKRFRLEDGRVVPVSRTLDLMTVADVLPWARAFGYA